MAMAAAASSRRRTRDFHVSRPRDADVTGCWSGEVAVVDFDQMCLAAPALDLATYAADVVRGSATGISRRSGGNLRGARSTAAAAPTTSAGTSARRSRARRARKAELVATVLPQLRPRVEALLDRLRRDLPAADTPVPAHGDFHVDQLNCCVAAMSSTATATSPTRRLPGPSAAACSSAPRHLRAADVVRRDGDLEAVEAKAALARALLDGYGRPRRDPSTASAPVSTAPTTPAGTAARRSAPGASADARSTARLPDWATAST